MNLSKENSDFLKVVGVISMALDHTKIHQAPFNFWYFNPAHLLSFNKKLDT